MMNAGPGSDRPRVATRVSIRTRPRWAAACVRAGSAILCGAFGLTIVGCQQDEEIRHYQVAKEQRPHDLRHKDAIVDMTGPGDSKSGETRLVAGVFPQGERTWFFKLTGRKADIDPYVEEFERFLHTVHRTGKAEAPVDWTMPDGWKREPGSDFRYATLRFGKDHSLDVSVSVAGGSLLANINRWRGQIGLAPTSEGQLEQFARELNGPEAAP